MNINTLDLNLLLIFDAMLRVKSTTLAGERVGVSQSGVSNALRRLREAFSDELFVRTDHGMLPTPLAEKMAGPIQAALDQIRSAVEDRGTFVAAHSDRHFRLAISDLGQLALLPWLMGHLQDVAPSVTVETVPLVRQGLAEKMSAGDIDIAIGVVKPMGAGFFRQRLQSHGYVCIARQSHPTIRDTITLEQFLHASFVEYYPTGGAYARFAEVADKLFAEARVARRVAARLAHMPGLARIISNSDHIAVIPEALARGLSETSGLQLLPLPFNQPRLHVTQQWHERIHKDPAHVWFREIIARHHGAGSSPSLLAVNHSRMTEAEHAA